ncbi:metallo beta-lactamase superfamily lipoprotein [Clostridium polyendosporum]|uniref:Metallo beta-lactamase superfamily lipoprotein n=1 Tax=Clostridium polyendosporum TaxID=69208 RepID=A0A919S210_9CLOT|nr:ComEC/Rec2 family competence protein [Clostridium polyendosporum]GIM30322.1 metallo beta-lactamase superfamily lipoprotein [Clostridium polyendosporum]
MKKKLSVLLSILILFVTTLFYGCSNSYSLEKPTNTTASRDNLLVHYIDVGQGDSILIQVNDKNLLIDAGSKDSQDKLMDYLKSRGIQNLDYVVATHPHEDHIGGMAQIIKNFNIGKFYAPKVTSTTKTFQNMMSQLKNKSLKVTVIKAGMGNDINLGENTKVEVYSPVSEKYNDLNDYSPIMKITYGKTSFLFTGDAEKLVEKEVLQKGHDVKADVLKLGHHGSTTSTGKEFLSKVNPKIGVISVGANNDYGHPHKETLQSLQQANIKIYRTDKDGTVVLSSNGVNITNK